MRDVSPLLSIRGFRAGFGKKEILAGIDLDLPRCGVHGLLGPAGVGKSTLLRTLARFNEKMPSFWFEGRVDFEGQDLLRGIEAEESQRRLVLLSQKARLYTASVLENAISEVRPDRPLSLPDKRQMARLVLSKAGLLDALEEHLDRPAVSLSIGWQRMLSVARLLGGSAEALLADEPLRDITDQEAEQLGQLLRRLGRDRCILLVTHNHRTAKELCDNVYLLTAGRIVESGTAQRFFSQPRTELGRDFVKLGNCWPEAEKKPRRRRPRQSRLVRPGGFHWILKDQLGGMQRPGLLQNEEDDLLALVDLHCHYLVTLTEHPYSGADRLPTLGIDSVHFPIEDMGVPHLQAAKDLCRKIDRWIRRGDVAVLHCKAGLGRTGTMLACALVYRGLDAVRAVDRVRGVNPRYIQSEVQLEFIHEFEEYLAVAEAAAEQAADACRGG